MLASIILIQVCVNHSAHFICTQFGTLLYAGCTGCLASVQIVFVTCWERFQH